MLTKLTKLTNRNQALNHLHLLGSYHHQDFLKQIVFFVRALHLHKNLQKENVLLNEKDGFLIVDRAALEDAAAS